MTLLINFHNQISSKVCPLSDAHTTIFLLLIIKNTLTLKVIISGKEKCRVCWSYLTYVQLLVNTIDNESKNRKLYVMCRTIDFSAKLFE